MLIRTLLINFSASYFVHFTIKSTYLIEIPIFLDHYACGSIQINWAYMFAELFYTIALLVQSLSNNEAKKMY